MHHASAITDKQGRFSMAGLSGGKYGIEIISADRAIPQWLGSKEKVAVKTGKDTVAGDDGRFAIGFADVGPLLHILWVRHPSVRSPL